VSPQITEIQEIQDFQNSLVSLFKRRVSGEIHRVLLANGIQSQITQNIQLSKILSEGLDACIAEFETQITPNDRRRQRPSTGNLMKRLCDSRALRPSNSNSRPEDQQPADALNLPFIGNDVGDLPESNGIM